MPAYKPVLFVLFMTALAAPYNGCAQNAGNSPSATLDSLIEAGKSTQSPATYFALLYYSMRTKIGKGIEDNSFTDTQLVRFIHKKFAEKYLEARLAFERKDSVPGCWKVALDTSQKLSYVQLLALGTNAHINHDLYFILKEYYTLHPEDIGNYKVSCQEIYTVSADETERVIDKFLEMDTTITGFNRRLIKLGRSHVKGIMRRSLNTVWKRAIKAAQNPEKEAGVTHKQMKLVDKNSCRFLYPNFLMKKGFNVLKGLDRFSFKTKAEMLTP